MKQVALAIVALMVLSLGATRAEADASSRRYAFDFFANISAGNEVGARLHMLSPNDIRATWNRITQQEYNRYVQSVGHEIHQMASKFAATRRSGKSIKVVDVQIISADAVSGRKLIRPTVVVTVRPIYVIEGKGRVVGDDAVKLVKVNGYWKLHTFYFD
jgi:hypothetical protein